MVGAAIQEIEKWLEQLSDEDLIALRIETDKVLTIIDSSQGQIIEISQLSNKMKGSRNQYFNKVNNLAKRLERGQININQFDRGMHDVVSKGFRDVYRMHKPTLSLGDEEYLNRAVSEELKYARKFGRDIKNKSSRMPRARRSAMYAQTLNGVAWHAKIEEQPDDVRIDWILGTAEHCQDCIILAAQSPYTKWNLPTTPRAGATACLSNCKCKLGFKKGALSKEELEDAVEYGQMKEQSLREFIETPKPPKGMRKPKKNEQLHIDNLRNKMNYQRRLIGSGKLDGSKLKEAIRKRKMYNMQLIEFKQQNKIYDVPIWSVDDILDERHVGRRVVKDIFRHGIDGRSLDIVSQKRLLSMLDHYEKQVGAVFSEDAIVSKLPKGKT